MRINFQVSCDIVNWETGEPLDWADWELLQEQLRVVLEDAITGKVSDSRYAALKNVGVDHVDP